MASQKKKYTEQCKDLIKSVTQFEEIDENFNLCLEFAVSNLLYHALPDVNSHALRKTISRLHEKFLIQSELEKANRFKKITDALLNHYSQSGGLLKEEQFSILSLILNLAGSGKFPKKKKPTHSGQDETSQFDWASYLRQDDINYDSMSDGSSELSLPETLTSSEEEDSLQDLPNLPLHPPPRDDSGLGISPDSCSGTSQNFHIPLLHQEEFSVVRKQQRNDSTFYPYWQDKHQRMFGTCPYDLKTMNFTKVYNDHLANQNVFNLISKKVVLHERNLIKEMLWMLSGIKDLFIAHWDGHKFQANSHIHLCNLTSNTLATVLGEFCEHATKLAVLQDFVFGVLYDTSEHCLTYQAYAQALRDQIEKINHSIYRLDEKLRKGDECFTLLKIAEDLKPAFHQISTLYCIHTEVCAEVSGVQDHPFDKACKVLHALWKMLNYRSLQDQESVSLQVVLRIFLKTCKPYFSFLEELIIIGSFRDPFGEFLVRKEDVSATHEDFWDSGMSLRAPFEIDDSFFLKPFLPDILCAGKSLQILNSINMGERKGPFRLHVEKGEMYLKFLKVLQSLISKKNKIIKRQTKIPDTAHDNFSSLSALKDPLLEQSLFSLDTETSKFFRPEVNPVYRPVILKVPESLFTEEYEDTERIIEELEPSTLKPITASVVKALNTCMEFGYYPVCRRLMKSLRDDHNIMRHLNVVRKYFLMESGDWMFSFYSEIFEKIARKEQWMDASLLYCALQNAIADDKEHSEKLCIFVDPENSEVNQNLPLTTLSSLQLSYEVEWPVSIMLGPKVQNEYCQIFTFLLQIKCAKYLLDSLYKTSLCKYEQPPTSNLMRALLKSKFPREQKIHGMHIIRMRLLFFVNGLHNYIMTRILHSFGLQFTESLEHARTVDEMVSSHQSYLRSLHERCLLDKRISYLREQIAQVLHLCSHFHSLWTKGTDAVSLEELQNIECQFSKFSNFLSCCFTTPLRRGTYLHLESLVTTMLSDSHSFHIFGNTN
ncbi:hypothetical protein JTE90_009844 [Oedothorax gibbosus]|uniref:Gamma-tubulin complex component n=1 Tax=Oedothorax gibbosus TaxID=931172 RepID=A0AAV6TZE1_9ARAC|nr:hypothetical protein JTE90_009844 [Oedothorax gibbosus]